MFKHQYYYRIKYFLKNPSILFWALIFPIILATLFKATFGGIVNRAETFDTIPVAVVIKEDNASSEALVTIMKDVSFSKDTKMFDLTETTKEDAEQLLKEEKVDGVVTISNEYELTVNESNITSSIIQQFLNEYLQNEAFLTDLSLHHPEKMQEALDTISKQTSFILSTSVNGGELDDTQNYFYSLIAMVCLFGCYSGLTNAKDIQANLSAIAARRCVSASKKSTLILADTLAALTIHYVEIIITFLYMRFVLDISIGEKPLLFFLTCFAGSLIGILIGQICGSVKGSANTKEGICTGLSLLMCFFSGLMFSEMKNIVDTNVPILNQINPAALITDCFYSLTVYDDYTRYTQNMITIGVFCVLLSIIAVLRLRRVRYESI